METTTSTCMSGSSEKEDAAKLFNGHAGDGKKPTRGECLDFKIKVICEQVKYYQPENKGKPAFVFPETSKFSSSDKVIIPPLVQLRNLKQQLSTFHKRHNTHYTVEFESGLTMNLKSINQALNFHTLLETRQSVEKEQKWFETHNFDKVSTETSFCQASLDKFRNILFNNHQTTSIKLHDKYVCIDDMATLTGDLWLSNFLVSHVGEKINNQCTDVKYMFLYNNSETFPNTVCGTLDALNHPSTCCKTSNPRIIFNFVVQRFPNGSTTLSPVGTHFVFAVYFPKENKLVYADSKGYNIPQNFLQGLKSGINLSGHESESLNIVYCHDPANTTVSGTHHCLPGQCAAYYPKQTCSNVCGVASIVGFVLCAIRLDLFMLLVEKYPTECPQLFSVKYLRNISQFSTFLRRIVAQWIMSPEIELSLMLRTTPVEVTCSKIENQTNSEKCFENISCLTGNGEGNKLRTEEPTDKRVNTCTTGNSKAETECPKINKFDSKTKLQVTSATSRLTKEYSRHNQYYLEYDNKLLNFLKCKPRLSHKFKEKKLCLVLSPKGTNHTIVKKVHCTELGCNDRTGMSKINDFLKSDACISKIQNLYSPNSDSKPGDNETDWTEVATVHTGQEMKFYFDKFKFDLRRQFNVHKCVKPKYQGFNMTLKSSITCNPRWGNTHRLDECYNFISDKPHENTAVVNLYIQCSGKTDQCRSECGALLSDIPYINTTESEPSCPGCGTEIKTDNSKIWAHCEIKNTSQWHNYNSELLCNVCYRHMKKYNKHRPSLPVQRSKSNKTYSSHLECKWKMKCVIYSDNLNEWKIYMNKNNEQYHQKAANQHFKRPNLSDRDEIDKMRTMQKSSANQIRMSFNRKTGIHTDDADSLQLKNLRERNTKEQIQARCKLIDKHLIHNCYKKMDDIPLEGSEWRNTEKILEENLDSVLLFQRGFQTLKRHYHFVLASDENLTLASRYGQHFIGYDNKYDFTSNRFPVGLVTICDNQNKGKAVAISMCNSDESQVHAKTLSIFMLNVPCNDESCDHKQEIQLYDDGNGFFKFRPCSLKTPIAPTVQHDKDPSIRSAVSSLGLNSSLCNFHALQAFRRHINEKPSLKLFLRPLETGLKTVMRSWNSEIRKSLIKKYVEFINNDIPDNLVSKSEKSEFISYLEKSWFSFPWCETFTSEILYSSPETERRNPLILTDNVTERKFRDIDESVFNSHLNRRIDNFVMQMTEQFLYSESNKVPHNNSSNSIPRKAVIHRVNRENKCANRGLQLKNEERLIIPEESLTDRGWYGVKFVDDSDSQTKLSCNLPDQYFETDVHEKILDNLELNYHTILTETSEIQELSQQVTQEHCYGTGNNVNIGCKRILSKLDCKIASQWHNELISRTPDHIRTEFNTEQCQYICNIKLGVCSCYSFITKGQPYYCKHLYSGLAVLKNIETPEELVSSYSETNPTHRIDGNKYNSNITATCKTSSRLQSILNEFISDTHSAELEKIRNKSLLKLLHDKQLNLSSTPGSLALRQPHNLGNRRNLGPIKEPKYNLVKPIAESTFTCTYAQDPYKPQVPFPDKSKERHGGRKRTRLTTRGKTFDKMVKSALHSLEVRLKPNYDNSDVHVHLSEDSPAENFPRFTTMVIEKSMEILWKLRKKHGKAWKMMIFPWLAWTFSSLTNFTTVESMDNFHGFSF